MARRQLHVGTDLYTDNDGHAAKHIDLHTAADALGYDAHIHSNRDNRPYRGAHVHIRADGGPDFQTLSRAVPVAYSDG